MLYSGGPICISRYKYELVCDELSEQVEANKQLEMENVALKLEKERLQEKIDNFNKALEGMRGVK